MSTDIDFSDLENWEEDSVAGVETFSANALENASESKTPNEVGQFKCGKCRGTGSYTYGYRFLKTGKCHACNGRGYFKTSPEDRRKSRTRAHDRKIENAGANWDAFVEVQPVASGWILESAGWSDFAASLKGSVEKYGDLTEKQLAAALKAAAKAGEKKAEREAKQDAGSVAGEGFVKVQAAFDRKRESGAKRISLRFGGLVITKAKDSSKNPGHLYLKENGEYAGKITPEGKVLARNLSDEGRDRLQEISADFSLAARVFGQQTGECCCCGRELTDPNSIEAGIGPICAAGWGI